MASLTSPDASAADPHSRAALEQRYGARWRWLVLLTVMIGTMASIMASTIVNVAVPDMSRVFALSQDRAQWLSASFMAAMTLSMLTTPWLLERFGYRHTFAGAVWLLIAGGVVGGFSRWFELVLAMRVVEGLAAGVMQPIPAIIIMRTFGDGERGRALGIFGFGVVLAPAVGPSIGGVLVEWFGWRSIFFVVVPFGLAALALARRYLPMSAPGGAALNASGTRLDGVGLALVTVVVLTLLNGMVAVRHATGPGAFILLGCSAAALALFVWHQHRHPRPLIELRLFSHRSFAMGSVVAFIYGMGLFGSTYLVPVFMQIALALPPSLAGAVLMPAGIALAITIPLAGRLTDKYAATIMVSSGLVLLAASFFVMVTVGMQTSLTLIALWALVGRIGLGLVLPSLTLGAMSALPDDLISQGASTVNFMRQLGGAVGISVVGIVLEWRLQAHPEQPLRGFHETFVLVGVILGCAVLAALRMGGKPRAAQARSSTP